MANSRVQADTGLRPEALTPLAAPVNTFVQTDAGNSLAQLAQGLSQLNPALSRFTSTVAEKVDTEQSSAGEAAARKMLESGQTYQQMVKKGIIPRGMNPFFVAGFKEQVGRVTADRWQSDFTAAVAKNVADGGKLAMTTDIRDFDKFMQEHRKGWIESNVGDDSDKFFQTGFGHRSDAYVSEARQSFASSMARRIEENAENVHYQEVYNHVLTNIDKHFTPEQIAADITQLNDGNIKNLGYDSAVVQRKTAQAVIAASIARAQLGDPNALQYLTILQHVNGKLGPLSTTEYGSKALALADKEIKDTLFEANQRERTQRAQGREDATRTTLQSAVQALMKNRHADLTPFASVLEKAGVPEAAAQLTSLQQNMNSLTFNTDQPTKQRLLTDIWVHPDTVTPQSVMAWMNRGKLDASDASWLLQQIAEQKRITKDQSNSLFADFEFQRVLGDLPAQFVDPISKIVTGEGAERADNAKAMLMQDWVHYREGEGKNAGPSDRIEWLKKQSKSIVELERQGPAFMTFTPPTGAVLEHTDPIKDKVLTPADIERVRGELRSGTFSTATQVLFQRLHLDTAEQRIAFLRAQMGLNKAATPETPNTNKKP
jgi:hypothetical protein